MVVITISLSKGPNVSTSKPSSPKNPTTAEIPFIYPAHWEADVVLRDGATAHLRPVVPTDREALETMYAGQSEKTIYLRFFGYKPKLSDKELTRFTTVDHNDRVAFVLFLGDEMIGIGRYDRSHVPEEAEVAFMISDAHQGRGIGSILLEHLAAAAKERGIVRFSAEVLPQNRKMLNVFKDAGYEVKRELDDGFVNVQFEIDPTERSRQVMEAREHRAEARSIAELLAPQTVVVMGDPSTWESGAGKLMDNIASEGFTGDLFAVCPGDIREQKYPVHASFETIEDTVDLAVIDASIDRVQGLVEQCGRAGVRGAVVMTTGYADDGARGRTRQKTLVRVARTYGMRLIGPASFGVINTATDIKLDLTLTEHDPVSGSLGIFTQSSALGLLLSNSAVRRGIGVSTLVSAGNRADVSGNDLMQYWEDDNATEVCGLYLESIGNPRKFSRIARRLARIKPVVVATNEVTGSQLPPGHSGRTSIAPAKALDSMFAQSGVIRADTVDQMLDICQILVTQPLPQGNRVAVVSNAHALGQLIAERATRYGVEVKNSEAKIDLAHDGLDVLYDIVMSSLEGADIDAAFAAFMPSHTVSAEEIATVLLKCSQDSGKPVVASFPGIAEQHKVLRGIFKDASVATDTDELVADNEEDPDNTANDTTSILGLPCFESAGQAVHAMASVMNYVQWRTSESGTPELPDGASPATAQRIINELMPSVAGEELLDIDQEATARILESYGISLLRSIAFETVEEAQLAVQELGGYPVVLKTTDIEMARRIDLGGVRLGIESDQELEREIEQMHRSLSPFGTFDLMVQRQAPGGQTAVLRALEDPLLGPVVSFGMAGDATVLLDDWAHGIPPLTSNDIDTMMRTPKAAIKLWGSSGVPAVRVDKLQDLIAKVASLKDNHPEIAHLELNPIMVAAEELTVVACHMKLGNPQQRTDSARRTMSS